MNTTTPRVRMLPDDRRIQLLDLGFELLATRELDQTSIDLIAKRAGVSRGLLYHYFGGKAEYYEAVVRHVADDLYARTAPPDEGEPLERLLASITSYVDYVVANQSAYRSLLKRASAGSDSLREIYDSTFTALADRFFTANIGLSADTPAARLMIRGWQAMTEGLVLAWCDEPDTLSRDELLTVLTSALPALLETLPSARRDAQQ